MVLDGVVSELSVDDSGCGWVGLDITLSVDGDVKSTCTARVALPVADDDNPWRRGADRWKP
jgi:hypothetical protein